MADRRNRPKVKVGHFTCTDADWEMIREQSQMNGTSVSRWLVEQSLAVNPASVAVADAEAGLSTEEERRLYELVESVAGRLDGMERLAGRGRDSVHQLLTGIFRMLEDLMVAQGMAGELNRIHRMIEGKTDSGGNLHDQ